MSITRRGKKGLFTHSRRVPCRYGQVEKRTLVRTSLRTSDELLARSKAAELEIAQNARWEALLAGQNLEAEKYCAELVNIADSRGIVYLPSKQVADLPLADIFRRVELANEDNTTADAALGKVELPKLPLSKFFGEYETLVPDQLTQKSQDQIRRWRNPRLKAIRNLLEIAGDVEAQKLTRDSVLQFRKWWWDRISTGDVGPNSANKEFQYLSAMFNKVSLMKGWDCPNPFRGIRFAQPDNARPPFSAKWISQKFLGEGALVGLNDEARDIFFVMVNTGLRPSEIIGLQAEHIHLEQSIPHIEIKPEGRELKTRHSERVMPLVGVSLAAMKRNPTGFPRYRGKPTIWSNAANKFLKENDLLETPQHSAYSLRHSLSDRLQNAGCEDRTRKEIMGHRPEGIVYGRGASLEVKHDWLKRIAVRSG